MPMNFFKLQRLTESSKKSYSCKNNDAFRMVENGSLEMISESHHEWDDKGGVTLVKYTNIGLYNMVNTYICFC